MTKENSSREGGPWEWLSRLTGRRQRHSALHHPGHSFLGLAGTTRSARSQARAEAAGEDEHLNTEEPIRVTALVQGTVQGVGFRYWTWRQAEKLGLAGSAVNQSDGSVKVIAEGPRWAVRDLLREIQGAESPGAVFKVDAHYQDAVGDLTDFTTG